MINNSMNNTPTKKQIQPPNQQTEDEINELESLWKQLNIGDNQSQSAFSSVLKRAFPTTSEIQALSTSFRRMIQKQTFSTTTKQQEEDQSDMLNQSIDVLPLITDYFGAVESVFTCRLVCKDWKNVIDSNNNTLISILKRMGFNQEDIEKWLHKYFDSSNPKTWIRVVHKARKVIALWDFTSQKPDDSLLDLTGNIPPGRFVSYSQPIESCFSHQGFDTRNQAYIAVSDSGKLNTRDPMTVEAWVKPMNILNAEPFHYSIVSKHGNASGWELRGGTEGMDFIYTVRNMHIEAHCNSKTIAPNTWHHFVGIIDRSVCKIFVDGEELAWERPPDWNEGNFVDFSGDLNIGRNPEWNDRHFEGIIERVRITFAPLPKELWLSKLH